MPCDKKFASFPNTRERPRRPTRDSKTYQVIALDPSLAGPVDASDENTITAANIGQKTLNGNTIVDAIDPDKTYLTLRNLDPAEAVAYGYDDLPDLATQGMILNAGDSVDTFAIDTVIYVRPLVAADVDCRVDKGEA